MIGRIKYKLLCWLLGDICTKSDCNDCAINNPGSILVFCPCHASAFYKQARKVWGLERYLIERDIYD